MGNLFSTNVDPQAYAEQEAWAAEGNRDYFSLSRSSQRDLYRSERFFLPSVIKEVDSCLDVGCAYGGFSRIMQEYNPSLTYTGVDIIPHCIEEAQRRYPDCTFVVSDGIRLPFPGNSFELVHSSGVLHVNSRYKDMVRDMYRVSSKYLLCDFRLTDGAMIIGEMRLSSVDNPIRYRFPPYYVLNKMELLDFLKSLNPRPTSIIAKGYPHPPNKTAILPLDSVVMAFFLISKGREGSSDNIHIEVNWEAI